MAQRRTFERLIHNLAPRLQEMEGHVKEAAKQKLRECADIVVEDAKRRCPVDTGKLRDSIKAESRLGGMKYIISANADDGRGYNYGRIVEYSPDYGQPFLKPAVEAHKEEIEEKVLAAIQAAAARR